MPEDTLSVFQIPVTTKDDFQRRFLASLIQNAYYPAKVTVLGTLYQPGMILIMKKESFGVLKVRLLKAISVKDKNVLFGCSSFECKQSKFGYYVTTKVLTDFECIRYRDIGDYHPVHRIGTLDTFVFALHNSVSMN